MESRAKFLGHSLHQQLVMFPLGLLAMAVIFDGIGYFAEQPEWSITAFHMIGAGIVTGLLAAGFGIVDYIAIPGDTRAKRIGTLHGVGNGFVLLLFVLSFALRWPDPAHAARAAYALSIIGFLLALVTGWLGGELVDRLGVGVDDDANLNAPSSLEPVRIDRR
jgi:uncharacterized membrane protein